MTHFLGIEASLSSKRWVGPTDETLRLAEAIAQQNDIPHHLALILARLGVDPMQAAQYLSPSLKELMPDPRRLRDMEKATGRIAQAIQDTQRIAIFADYDVDGATSAALLFDYFSQLGLIADIYVPDRLTEGYGPNVAAMQKLAAEHDLIICVDCGTVSFDPIAAVDCDVIVLDHHLGRTTLPDAFAVVNPNRADESVELGYLCAAGVVFLFLVELNRQRRAAGLDCPDLMPMLDLAALGTVADVAPLREFNRAIVVQGLKIMAARARPGLVALADVAGINTTPNSYHLGYLLGPRINAGGRIGKANLGARLLTVKETAEAEALAEKLNTLNQERRVIEAETQLKAFAQIEERGVDAPLLWAMGVDWHPGILGIVAARIKEKTNRPVIVMGVDDGEAKGSGRSVSGIDLGSAVAQLVEEGVLSKGGGHKMAAGLSCPPEQVEPAMARLEELLIKQGADQLTKGDVRLDGLIAISAINTQLIEQLNLAGPFGASAPAPRFAIAEARVNFVKVVGENHLKLRMSDDSQMPLDAIYFGGAETEAGAALLNHNGAAFHFAGRLDINEWQGRRTPQLIVDDVALAG
ncbi:MAG: single-stranded-DNA-specific exonuclease RecJ [Pseudomonadota bacterium]